MHRAAIRCLLALAIAGPLLGSGAPEHAVASVPPAGKHKNIASPVPLHAPWPDGVTFKMVTYYGRGGHSDKSNNYYATDWVKKGAACDADIGTPILAPAAGTVTDVLPSDEIGSGGNTLILQFDDDPAVSMWFEHLDRVDVGQTHVNSGQKIGELGRTGLPNDICAHLHIGVYQYIDGVNYSIKSGRLDGQKVVRGASITSHNDGSTPIAKPRKKHQPHDTPRHAHHHRRHRGA